MAKTTVSAGYIAANAITSTELAANSVTAASISAGAILSVDVGANSVTSTAIAANAVNTSEIASNAVSTAQIASNAVTAASIATNAVGADQISPNAVKASELASDALSGQNFTGDVTFDTNVLFVDSVNNRVGIGTTSPADELDISSVSPAIRLTDTTTAGLYHTIVSASDDLLISADAGNVGANTEIEFAIDGSEKMRINSSGNVGIGTTSPSVISSSVRSLSLGGTSTTVSGGIVYQVNGTVKAYHYVDNDLLVHQCVSGVGQRFWGGASEAMRIDSSGRIGIGWTVPDELLVVDGDIKIRSTNRLHFTNTSDQTYIHAPSSNQIAFGTNSTERMRIDSSGNVGIGTSTTFSNPLTLNKAAGAAGSLNNQLALTHTGASTAYHIKTIRAAATDEPAGLAFVENTTERMRIDGSGNVGVGTSSPSYLLDVAKDVGQTTPSIRVWNKNSNWGAKAGIRFLTDVSDSSSYPESEIGNYRGDGGSTPAGMYFSTGTSTISEKMKITTGGNVGIGTTNPQKTLDVTGSLAISNSTTSYWDFDRNNSTGDLYVADTGTDRFILTTSGNIQHDGKQGIMGGTPSGDIACRSGTSTPSTKTWRWGGNIGNDSGYFINNNNAGVAMSYGSTAWSAHSDERVKENIVSLGEVLPEIQNIRCVKYNRIGDDSNTKIGFIAQDWQSTSFAEVVDNDTGFVVEEDGRVVSAMESESTEYTKMIAYTETIPVLLKAIQELKTELDAAKARITELENA